jgi:hypothetical protein
VGAGREVDAGCDAHGREFVGGTGVGVGFEIGFWEGMGLAVSGTPGFLGSKGGSVMDEEKMVGRVVMREGV